MQNEIKISDIAEKLHFTIENTHKLLEIFYESSSNIVNHLEESFEENDYDKIYRYAHSLKGSSSNLLFNEVANICKEIENSAQEQNSDFPYLQEIRRAKALIKETKII